jgi:ribonuclease HI
MGKFFIFADGASKGNPGPGGWGVVALHGDTVIELGGKENNTTNNRMELTAVIEALRHISLGNITIYTDSAYVVNGITKWIKGWEARDWKTLQKEDVLNKDLWQRLDDLVDSKKIEWKLVSGHVGIAGNERVDEIATAFASGEVPKLFNGQVKDYGIKNILEINYDEAKQQQKKKSSARSKIKAYSYISLVDGVLKIHKTWAECEKEVKGKSKAKFMKSINPEDEQKIVSEWKK